MPLFKSDEAFPQYYIDPKIEQFFIENDEYNNSHSINNLFSTSNDTYTNLTTTNISNKSSFFKRILQKIQNILLILIKSKKFFNYKKFK